MLVHYSKDKAYRFKVSGMGLYYLKISNPEIITIPTEIGNTDYYLFSTMNKNLDYFTRA